MNEKRALRADKAHRAGGVGWWAMFLVWLGVLALFLTILKFLP